MAKIRSVDQIQVMKIGKEEQLMSLYADDILLFAHIPWNYINNSLKGMWSIL